MISLSDVTFRVIRRMRWRSAWKVKALPIDVGKANEHWFLNAASIGFGAEVTAATPPELKRLLGQAAYTRDGCDSGDAMFITIEEGSSCRIAKSRAAARWRSSAMVVRQAAVSTSLRAHALTMGCSISLAFVISRRRPCSPPRDELQDLSPEGEYISYWQTPWAEVHTEEAIPVNLDGEPVHFSSVRYEAVPRAIRLILPPNCPLLSQPDQHDLSAAA